MQSVTSSSSDSEVAKAVEFLNCFTVRGYPESNLKKYLTDKRGLSTSQINEAFRLYHSQKTSKSKPEKPQKRSEFSSHVSFLVREKQQEGTELIKNFLKQDAQYCEILRCLKEVYYKELSTMADAGKFQMAREEVDRIFRHIPTLYEFHQVFNADMNRGCNIGWMFVGLFIFFHGYVDYMKDCLYAIKKMRDYIKDDELQECLTQIRRQSKRRKDNMVDLLLVPLDRIQDYKNFLDQLYEWADNTQVADYEFLGKASRRIGRVASYVGQYKHGISNRNEMNKVQLFVGNQCNVLNPNRLIVRRGMMNCWAFDQEERKMPYMFFLFNDILLLTTKERQFPKIVELWNAKVLPSKKQEKLALQFKIVSGFGKNHQILFLECKTQRQRDGWFKAVEAGILAAKNGDVEKWSTLDGTGSSDKEKLKLTNKLSLENVTDEEDDSPCTKDSNAEWNKADVIKEIPQKFKISLIDEEYPKLDNYGSTRSFKNQEFQEFKPLSRTLSTNSIQDFDFGDDQKHEKLESSTSTLSNRSGRGVNFAKVKFELSDERKGDSGEIKIRRNAYGCATSLRKNFFISNPNSRRASVTGGLSGVTTPRTVFFDQRTRLNNIIEKAVSKNAAELDSKLTSLLRDNERSYKNRQELSAKANRDRNVLSQQKDQEDDEISRSESSSLRCIDTQSNIKARKISSGKRVSISLRLNDVDEVYTK